MAENAAEFTLRLHNEINRPAREAQEAIRKLSGGLVASRRELARTESALASHFRKREEAQRNFVPGGGVGLTGGIAGALGGGAGIALGLGVAGASALAIAVGAVSTAFIGATASALDFGQRSKLAFSSLIGDAALGAATFEQVRRDAQKLGLVVNETVDSYRDLLAAQFSIGEANQLIRASADLKAIGADAHRIQLALLAITQIKMKGVLQAEEMRQLVNTGVSAELIYNNLAKRLGKTRAEILKLQEARKITADDAILAFKEAIKEKTNENELGDTATKFANSKISGMLAQTRGMVDNAFITLGGRLESSATKLSARIFGTIQKIADSPGLSALGDRLVRGFDSAVAFVDTRWPRIEKTILGGVEAIASATGTASDFIVDHWDDIKAGLMLTAGAMAIVGGAAAIAAASTLLMLSPILAVTGAVGYLSIQLVKGSAELAKWARIASSIAILIPGFGGAASSALQGIAAVADRGGAITPLEEQIRQESRDRAAQAGVFAANQAGQVTGGAQIRNFGGINVPVSVQALDLEDPEKAGQILGGTVAREVRRVLQQGNQ